MRFVAECQKRVLRDEGWGYAVNGVAMEHGGRMAQRAGALASPVSLTAGASVTVGCVSR